MQEVSFKFKVFIDGVFVRNAREFQVTAGPNAVTGSVTIIPPSFLIESVSRDILIGGLVQIFIYIDDIDDYVLVTEGLIRGFTIRRQNGRVYMIIHFGLGIDIFERFFKLYRVLARDLTDDNGQIKVVTDIPIFSMWSTIKEMLKNGQSVISVFKRFTDPPSTSKMIDVFREVNSQPMPSSLEETTKKFTASIPREWRNYAIHADDYLGWLDSAFGIFSRFIDLSHGITIMPDLLANEIFLDLITNRINVTSGFVSDLQIFQMIINEMRLEIWGQIFPKKNNREKSVPVQFVIAPEYVYAVPVAENYFTGKEIGDLQISEDSRLMPTHYIAISRARIFGRDFISSTVKSYSSIDETISRGAKLGMHSFAADQIGLTAWGGPVPIVSVRDPIADLAVSERGHEAFLVRYLRHSILKTRLGIINQAFAVFPRLVATGAPGIIDGSPKVGLKISSVGIMGNPDGLSMIISPSAGFLVDDDMVIDPSPLIRGDSAKSRLENFSKALRRAFSLEFKDNPMKDAIGHAKKVDRESFWDSRIKLKEFADLDGDIMKPKGRFAHYGRDIFFKLRSGFILLMNEKFLEEGERIDFE